MGVVPIGHKSLTRADLAVFMESGEAMVQRGIAGSCVRLETPEGDEIVALLDLESEYPVWIFGKSQGWYYVLDGEFRPIAQGQLIDEVLSVLPNMAGGSAQPLASYA